MNRKSNDKAKRQHWAPRSYLRHFATPESKDSNNPLVWIFSKDSGHPRLTSTSQVAAECFLYSPRLGDGTRLWEMEEELSDLEGLMAGIWPAIADQFVDLHGDQLIRQAIALFVSTMYLRHPRRLLEIESVHAQLVELYNGLPKNESGNPQIDEVECNGVISRFDSSDWQEYKAAGREEKRRMFVDSLRQNAIHCAGILMKKRWSVVFAEAPLFITTDTPVAVCNSERAVFGLRTPGTVISFPLSPTRVLMMDELHNQPKGQYYRLGVGGPAPVNFTAWRNCERFMISSRSTDAVCAEIVAWTDRQ